MKTLVLILMSLILSSASCKKHDQPTPGDPVVGHWWQFATIGGIAGLHEYYPADKSPGYIIFRPEQTCTIVNYSDSNHAVNTTYTVHLDKAQGYIINIATGMNLTTKGNDTMWTVANPNMSDQMFAGYVRNK